MITEVAAAYESVKAATTIVRGLSSLNTKAEVNQAVIEIQGHLLDTQHTVMQMQDKMREMKAEIEALERFRPKNLGSKTLSTTAIDTAAGGSMWKSRRESPSARGALQTTS